MTKNNNGGKKPPGRFVTTKVALEKAELIANALNLPFDPEQTALEAEQLHKLYFDEIVELLEIDTSRIEFISGSYRLIGAVAGIDPSGDRTIELDELLDGWLMTLTHLIAVMACKVLDDVERIELLNLFDDLIDLKSDTYMHEEWRDRFLPFAINHKDVFNVSHALSRAMLIFVICHELAHCELHHFENTSTPANELEADQRAAEYFARIIALEHGQHRIFIDRKVASAPLLLMRLFELNERRRLREKGYLPDRTTHPAPADRRDRLQQSLEGLLTGKAAFLAEGLDRTVDDIAAALELPQIS